jgi:hypothetical protein
VICYNARLQPGVSSTATREPFQRPAGAGKTVETVLTGLADHHRLKPNDANGTAKSLPDLMQPVDHELSWCEQKWTGLCEQKWNNALALLPAGVCSVILLVASAEDRALRGRNPSAV